MTNSFHCFSNTIEMSKEFHTTANIQKKNTDVALCSDLKYEPGFKIKLRNDTFARRCCVIVCPSDGQLKFTSSVQRIIL